MSLKRKGNSVVPFYNHVKLGVALEITRDGLKHLITETSEEFHNALFENIPKTSRCTSCYTANLLDCPTVSICRRQCNVHNTADRRPRPCRQNLCNVIRDRIRENHRYYRTNVYEPSWMYTDSTLWSVDPFEIIKCFLPFNGYDRVKSVEELDFQGVVSVIINNKYFQKQLSEDLSKPDNIYSKALERLSFYNGSSALSVSDTELNDYLEILMRVLGDSKYLKEDAGARKALTSLQQLKADVLMISSYTIKHVLEESIKSFDTQIFILGTSSAFRKRVIKAKRDLLTEALSLFHSTPRKFRSTQLRHMLNTDSVISAFQTLNDVTGLLNTKTEMPLFPADDETGNKSDTSKPGSRDSLDIPGTSKPIRPISESVGIQDTYKDLQSDLIHLYRERHATLPLSPLIQKNKAPLLDFYVPPTIHIVETEKRLMDYREYTSYPSVNSLSDIFMKNSRPCKNIYLTSDPGAGKTSFAKHLTLTWCQAHEPELDKHAYFKEEKDLEEMRKFKVLFFIPLSDAKRECDIHSMIQSLLVSQLESESSNKLTNIVQEVLRKEKCLIILDGLDEWKHPSSLIKVCRKGLSKLPHNNIRENCTTLTTTRTWAVDTARKDQSEIDQLLGMPGLGKKSSEELISNVITHLNNLHKGGKQREINEFHEMIVSKGLQKFESVPVVLMQLLCLWYDGIDPGEYQSQIYSNMLEFLFRRAEETHRLKSPAKYKYRRKLPECFAENEFCKRNADLLYSLGELAFSTLFGNDEPLYVFDQSETRKHLKSLHKCLGVGILCQTENFEKISADKLNIFFLHKTFQEFFAALHIVSSQKNCQKMISVLNKKYKTVRHILSLETVFAFISGFSNLKMSEISNTINDVIKNDSIRRDYRTNMGGIFLESYIPMSSFCDMIAKCLMEIICSKCNEIKRIYLEDIFVDSECADDRYLNALRHCISLNSSDIKSLSIRVKQNIPDGKAKDIILKLGLDVLQSLQKLSIWGEIPRVVLQTLLEKSQQTMVCLDIWGMTFYFEDIGILAKLIYIQALSILSLQMSHEMIEEIVGVIQSYTSLNQFTFNDVHCLTHSESCPGYRIQLSEKAKITVLFLDKIYATEIVLNAEPLQMCGAEWLYQKGALKTLLKCVQKSKRLEKLDCDGPASTEDRDTLVQVATSLHSLKFLRMRNLNFDAAPVNIDVSSLQNIRRLHVNGVNMTGQSLKSLILQFNAMKQSVIVCLENVTISETDNYDDIMAALFAKENTVSIGTFNEKAELMFKTNPKSHDRRKHSVTVEESAVWDKCIELLKQCDLSGAGVVAETLIEKKEMPSKDQLKNLQQFRKSAFSLIQHVCKEISSLIKSKYANIESVWPSYTVEKPDEIVFVVEVKTTQTEEFEIAYDHLVRTVDVFSDEGIVVRNKCEEMLSPEYSEKIQRCINRNCLRLMRKHKNLSIIDGSPVRSKGYISNSHLMQSEPCLVLYVKVKNYIPIDEEPFEREYDGFPVDVREGAFVLFMQNNDDVGTKLKMGCEISSEDRAGTLGGFVEHLHHGLCGLTCAHVVLSGTLMNELKNRGGVATWPEIKQCDSVFVPGKPSRIGRLTNVICDEGGNGTFGMDVALFQIETDHPKSGEFYNHPNIQGDEQLRFDTGKVCGLSRLEVGTPVYKFGATTGMTKGRIINPRLTISVQTHARRGFTITLHNQIEVEGVGQNGEQCKFSDGGDSGALVMMKTADGEHMCIGIVEGGTCRGGNITNTTTVVTPIVPVLERLKVISLKSFETKELSEQIKSVENRLESLEKKLDQWGSAIMSRLNIPASGNNPSSSQANV